MKKKWFIAAAVLVLTVMAAGCSLKGGISDEGGAETKKEREERRRVDPEEFEAEEILWVDLMTYHEETDEREEISLWLDPGEGEADIDGETYELSDDRCNELQKLILEYSLTVEEKRDEYWPTGDYPAMPVLFQFEMTGWEKYYAASGALCYPDGWKEFVGTLKEIVGISGSGQKTADTGKSGVSPETGALKDKTAELEQVSPEEFAEDEISFFSLLSYYEDTGEIEGITLFLYPGEEEAHIVSGGEEDQVEEVRLNEEQSDALKQLILQYSRTVWEQEDEYWPSDTEEASVMAMIFDFRMSGAEKEYKADGGLCYPDGWEDFIEELKKIIS